MAPETLKIGLLVRKRSAEPRPRLFTQPSEPWTLKPSERAYVAAVAIGPDFEEPTAADRSRWTTQEVLGRALYDDGTLSRARSGLGRLFREHGLDPDDYFVNQRGEHGMLNVKVDVVELIAVQHDARAVDRLLDEWELQDAELPAEMTRFVSKRVQKDLADVLATAADRHSARGQTRRRRSIAALTAGVAAVILAVVIALVVIFSGGTSVSSGGGQGAGRTETAGSGAGTHSDYKTGGGASGPPVPGHRPVRVSCRVRGLEVPNDDNPWWYRIGSAPWDGRFYASADAFYNRPGQRTGSLVKTPFVDDRVPLCRIANRG